MHVPPLSRRASRSNIRHKQRRKQRRRTFRDLRTEIILIIIARHISLVRPTSNLDRCAVHIHLAITDLVKPRPSQRVGARSDTGRNAVLVRVRIGGSAWTRALGKVAGSVSGRTAAFDGVDDHPFRALRCGTVCRQGNLTGAAAMDSSAVQGENLLLANGHVGYRGAGVAGGFAGEVGPVGC